MTKRNPFDSKVTKTKFKVLNKSIIGVRGKPQVSKTKQQELRRKTILEEYNRRDRSGNFIDRRFGAKNASLTSEDVMMKRFSRERMKSNEKKQKFNLNDNDIDYDETLHLTHGGRNLLDIHDMDLEGSDPEDEFAGNDGHSNSLLNDVDNDVPRSREEIMKEIISKSKSYRSERQKIKEENTILCEELDDDFDEIFSTLDKKVQPIKGQKQAKDVQDDYSTSIREMAFDSRSKPSNRTPTAQETLEKEKKKDALDKKSKEERMNGIYADNKSLYDDDNDDVDGMNLTDSKNADDSSDADKSFKKVQRIIGTLLFEMGESLNDDEFNKSYLELVAISKTNSVIQVAKVFREKLSIIGEKCAHNLRIKGKSIMMPSKNDLIIFHLIGQIFSTSDYHHLVVTPAKLLIIHLLEHGRIIEEDHLSSSLFLMQTLLSWEEERNTTYSPELLTLLHFFLFKISGTSITTSSTSSSIYKTERLISSKVNDFLQGLKGFISLNDDNGCSKMILDDIITFKKEKRIITNIEFILKRCIIQCPPALTSPLISLAIDIGFNIEKSSTASNRPLLMQKHKPVALPELMPEFGADDKEDKEELNIKRLKHQYKRELKSAKRELKKDNLFLNREKWEIKKKSDASYREKHQQIIGSIANENFENEKRKK